MDNTIQKKLYEIFKLYSEKIAIEYGFNIATYDELDKKSNYIANWILSKGIKKGSFIPVLLDDRIELITFIIGILKAGCVFVPVDSAYPDKRIEKMLELIHAECIFIDDTNIERIHNDFTIKEKYLVNEAFYDNDTIGIEVPVVDYSPDDPIYIYFTSGTTGEPKGIVGKNKSLLHFIKWEIEQFEIDESFYVSQLTSPGHDPLLRDVFVALFVGGVVCIPESKEIILNSDDLINFIELSGVNLIHCTPSLFRILNVTSLTDENLKSLKYVLMAGEKIIPTELSNWYSIFGDRIQLVNMYGPTETTMVKTFYPIKPTDIHGSFIPAGQPMKGARIIILDKNMAVCKAGETGEIYIRTPYMTLGYHNNPEQNKAKFIKNPFSDNPTDMIYKTGDLGKILPDNNLMFMGRIDRQIKIRGNRVELLEIENLLLGHELVKEIVVTDFENINGDTQLCAYIVQNDNQNMEIGQLQAILMEYVQERLPMYMIPSHIIQIEKLPITANGKLDYKALPNPENNEQSEYIEPRNDLEITIRNIWSEILNKDKISVTDNFMKLGGHSLNVMKLISKIYEEFEIEMPLGVIFSNATIESMAEYIQSISTEVDEEELGSIEKVMINEDGLYLASSAQKRQYILKLIEGEQTNYNLADAKLIEGLLNKNELENILKKIIQRHESLRTSFETIDGEIFQKIHNEVPFTLEYLELDTYQHDDITQKAKAVIQDFIKPFNLEVAPLLRAMLIKLEEEKHVLVYDMHHIICDEISIDIFTGELVKFYNGEELPPVEIQYKDYSYWENQLLASDKMREQEEYWMSVFQNDKEIPTLNMPTDHPRPHIQSFEGNTIGFELDVQLTEELNRIGRENGATLYIVMLAALNIIFSKYTGQEDIIIGAPVANRQQQEVQNSIGMFVNTLAMRNYPEADMTFTEFLQTVKHTAFRAYENQDYQFDELIDRLKLVRSPNRSVLFDIMFVLHNMHGEAIDCNEVKFSSFEFDRSSSKLDMTISAVERNQKIEIQLEYCTKLYKQETIERFICHFKNILKQVVDHPHTKIREFNMLSELEKNQITKDFNNVDIEYDSSKTIHQLFEEKVKETPDRIAVIFKDETLTYRELNNRANSIARTLRDKGVGTDEIVAIMVEPSLEMLIGIMGILKAGGAYLPIDPKYPMERIDYIIEDSKTSLILTQAQYLESINFSGQIIDLEDEGIYKNYKDNLDIANNSKDLAYVIYTSGSTGRPKGTMVEHSSVVNTLMYLQREYPMGDEDSYLLKTTYTFDVSVPELFGWFMGEGSLVLLESGEEKNIESIINIIEKQKITHINFVPSLLNVFVDVVENRSKRVSSLKYVFVAGEALSKNLVKKFHRNIKGVRLENLYGPTEATIYATRYSIENPMETNVPIGKPIKNTQIHIVDKNNKLQAIGVPGEICISGRGLARGYLNQDSLTNEKFINHPFGFDGKMYKTGDVGRWLPDGNIEFLGRGDHQVKIRGYRIEIGEIESQLLNQKTIKEAVVVPLENEDGNKYLCAYIVAEGILTTTEVKSALAKCLPDYMIPAFIVVLDKMPLTNSGKIDRKVLPLPQGNTSEVDYEAPRNEMEETLVEMWRELLLVDEIGINNNFFDLGGHSLKAMRLVAKIHKTFDVDIHLKEIFANPTIKGLADFIGATEKSVYSGIEVVEESKYYSTSPAQRRLYTLQQFDGNSTGYNMPGAVMLEGTLDVNRLKETFEKLIDRHESLRTTFKLIDGEPVQCIQKKVEFNLLSMEAEEEELEEIVKNFIKPFDLSGKSLLRVGLVKVHTVDVEKNLLIFDMHHIISDGTSIGILIKEFTDIYRGIELEPLKIQYKDYSQWQKKLLTSRKIEEQKRYWLQQLAGEIPVLNLMGDFPRPALQSFEGDRLNYRLDKELVGNLKRICKETGTTLYMVLLSAYNVLLSKYSGQEDIIVGSPIAGRTHGDLNNIMGMFVNTLAMRNYPEGDKTYKDFLAEVKQNALEAYENQDYQFEELVGSLNLRRDMSRNPLFDVVFTMQNMDMDAQELEGLRINPYSFKNTVSKFDLTLFATEDDEMIQIGIEYATKIFKKESIERFYKHLQNIIQQITKNPEMKLSEIDLITEEEKSQLLKGCNNGKVDYPRNKTLHQLFEEQVERTPDNIAVVFEEETLTYQQLNEKANQGARLLVEKGVKTDTIVGIMVERSLDMIVGIMAILKAGGTYLPIDPDYPVDRIKYMLKDSGSQLLLTQSWIKERVQFGGKVVSIDDRQLYTGDCSNLRVDSNPDNVAYIIYTSGSTGNPKGVMIEHKNVVRLMINDKNLFSFNSSDVWTMFHSFCFDFSVWEMYGALLYGGKLIVIPKISAQNPAEFLKILKKEKVTVLNQTPTAFYNLIKEETATLDHHVESIRYIIFGGEALKPSMLKPWWEKYPNTKLINMYGITETTVHVTYKEITGLEIETNVSNIGKAIPTLKTYVMDQNMKLVPIGVAGELYVGGEGVARGYLNQKELTMERFVQNPYNMQEKMYRSGDLVRLLANGDLEYLGRIDHQVKIRGHRIELAEIEKQLQNYQHIKEAIVVAKDDQQQEKYLCAYIVAEKELAISEIRSYLSKELPDYLIPSHFVLIEKMPLTSNGKIDRKALLELDGSILSTGKYEAPRNNTEEELVEIWKEILGLEKIGITDNFFELGGHSLKATNMISKIHKRLNIEVPLKEIFREQTIKSLAEYINITEKSSYSAIEVVEKKDYYQASSAQKRIYTLQQFDKNGINYNMAGAVKIEGSLEPTKLEECFENLINRHEALRTSFDMINGELVQIINEENISIFNYVEKNEDDASHMFNSFIKPFNLRKAPLFRVELVKVGKEEYLLFFDMHHIISDGVSMEILVKDLMVLYGDQTLEPLKIQYKDYSEWQINLFNSDKIEKQKKFWLEQFRDEIPVLNIMGDFQRPTIKSFEGDRINHQLEERLTSRLRNICKETGTTMYMVLLSAFNVLLSKYSGQEDIVVGSPIAGRQQEDLNNVIGMFVNTLAMRNYPQSEKTFKEFLAEVKQNAVGAYENQDYQFEELVDDLNLKRDLSRNPLFDVMFAMNNVKKEQLNIEGLSIKSYYIESNISKFDMTLSATEDEEGIDIEIEFATKIFRKETIERLYQHLVNILEQICQNSDIKLLEIQLPTEEEKQQILSVFNNTKKDYPKDQTIQQLFEEQVKKTPNNVAVVFEEKSLTYNELNQQANQIARQLVDKGVKKDTIVAIMMEASLEMVVGIMAILKAGGAYLPIDPQYPKARVEYMLEDSGAELFLTQSWLLLKQDFKGESILLDEEDIYTGDASNLRVTNTPKDLAYVIYTSGSTGKPKGVMVEHHSLVNLCKWHLDYYEVTEFDRSVKYAGFAFDASVLETISYLLAGASIYIIDQETKLDVKKINQYFEANKITISFLPTQIYEEFMNLKNRSLRKLFTGGDKLKKYSPQTYDLVNVYGPTENTVASSYFQVKKDSDNIPIGEPIANTQIYILDAYNNLQPIGVAGELCVGGVGLARGYFNKPELTEEKFVMNPFIDGERMYKTGDLARWLPDGNVEFLGRIDNQVKIRGYRIELGEIESKIMSYQGVVASVLDVKEDITGDKYLCAYIVADEKIEVKKLREELSTKLPEYMIPAYIMQLDKIPLTPNGKIDRNALPESDGSILSMVVYEEARNEIEATLVDIWEEILGIKGIGINHNFFDIGGHSLKAISLVSKINSQFNEEISLGEIFKSPTIKGISKQITGNKKTIKNENAVLLKKGSETADNIFLIHDGSGDVGGYIEFCNRLQLDFNCWGIRADKLKTYGPENWNLEEIAKRYIDIIKDMQSVGHYNIMGWSLGGNIAFEMIRQLEAAKEKIGFFIMLDSHTTENQGIDQLKTSKFEIETEMSFVKDFLVDPQLVEGFKNESVENLWGSMVEHYKENKFTIDMIKESIPENILNMLAPYKQQTTVQYIYQVNLIRTLINANQSYVPKNRIKTQAHMVKAQESRSLTASQWNRYCEKTINLKEISGDHFTIFKEPNVGNLVEQVEELIVKEYFGKMDRLK